VTSTAVVDANVILRYLLGDHAELYEKAAAFMVKVKTGESEAYIPDSVLAECVYALLKVYGVPRREVASKLGGLLTYKGIHRENQAILRAGIELFGERNVDIVDALVFAIAERRRWSVASFDDADFRKLKR
jgi:predicted nucleic acid-binding protein